MTMSAKSLIFSLLMACPVTAAAQTDSIEVLRDSLTKMERRVQAYEKRVDRYNHLWNSLRPAFMRLQYAGSIGLVNIGTGWEYGRRRQWETDIMIGIVPKYEAEDAKVTLTLRQTFHPIRDIRLNSQLSIQPLACGVFINSILNSEYWAHTPSRYPTADYYWFSSKIRSHIFIGQRYTWHIPIEKRLFIHSLSVVWELNTCDLYIVSKAVNSTLPLKDVLSLSFGLKMNI